MNDFLILLGLPVETDDQLLKFYNGTEYFEMYALILQPILSFIRTKGDILEEISMRILSKIVSREREARRTAQFLISTFLWNDSTSLNFRNEYEGSPIIYPVHANNFTKFNLSIHYQFLDGFYARLIFFMPKLGNNH